jgi:hypothetical protein
LINRVESNGGEAFSDDVRMHDTVVPVAVFTQMPEKQRMLQHLGDVFEMDDTHTPLKTNGEISPVTLMHGERHVQCGGTMLAAFVISEAIIWLLAVLMEGGPELHEPWRALIADGDSAFVPAAEGFNDPVAHTLCEMHKEGNVLKALNRCGFAKNQRDRAARLFRRTTGHGDAALIQVHRKTHQAEAHSVREVFHSACFHIPTEYPFGCRVHHSFADSGHAAEHIVSGCARLV